MHGIQGIIVPMITPLDKQECVNESALREITNHLIDAGVHGLFPCGSQGEFFSLDTAERKRVLEIVIDETAGRTLVMAGTGAVTTRESVELTQHAQAAGANAVSVITPYFIKPSDNELIAHFCTIAESVTIPVLGYSNPGRTGGLPLSPAVAAAIAQQSANFCGIKDSSGDLTNTMAYIAQCPEGFLTFMGRDTLIYAALTYGCAGAVAATANVAPKLVVGIYEAFVAGDRDLALTRQRQLAPLRHAFGLGSFPVVVKDAMNLLGLPAGPCRRPITSIDGSARQQLVGILCDMGLE